jgi:ubiquinone/menaquinone biosynthesis C-methylase UbiE
MALDLKISADDIERAFAPHVLQRFAEDDSEWCEIVARLGRKERRRYDRFLCGELPTRDRQRVEQQYAAIWNRSLDEQLTGRPTAFEWSRGTYLARSSARKRVHQFVLLKTLEAIAPRTVLEVGCGNGFNLLLLSGQFPEICFAGLELTAAGAHAARGLLWDAEPSSAAAEFFVGSIRDREAPRRVQLCRGTGAQLPFRSSTFDVIYTVLALEQMESIRDAVLTELRRVATRYVVMIEPFQELNAEGLRRQYIASNQYFDARIDSLTRFGLRPVLTLTDMPNKVSFHVGLVVAELI